VNQGFLSADDREDDDDGEPSLAVPEVSHWDSQEQVWRSACRSRLRDEELEPNLGFECREMHSQNAYVGARAASAALDELERDLDTEEADELDEREGDELEICGEQDDASDLQGDDFPYSPVAAERRRTHAPTDACAAEVRAALSDPKRSGKVIKPRGEFSNVVWPPLAQWRTKS
jgi:hypothetical protein